MNFGFCLKGSYVADHFQFHMKLLRPMICWKDPRISEIYQYTLLGCFILLNFNMPLSISRSNLNQGISLLYLPLSIEKIFLLDDTYFIQKSLSIRNWDEFNEKA